MKLHLAPIALAGFLSGAAPAAVINVPADHLTIQAGIVAANPGDVVIVAQGEYFETIDFLGKAITVRSTDPNDVGVVLNTIIDGGGTGSVVTCSSSEGPDTVLNGFVITGGTGTAIGETTFGGGMYNFGSSPTVNNCLFSGNTANVGGGMFNTTGSPTVSNCSFSGNAASDGGGMYNFNNSPTVTNCSFGGNTAFLGSGGGMFNSDSNPTMTNCSFSANTADLGGGMSSSGSSPTVINCSFSGNRAIFDGGGMYNINGSSPTVTKTGFCNNTLGAIFGTYTDGGGNSLLYCLPPIPVTPSCSADLVDDGSVNVSDLLALLAAWGACP